MAKDLEIELKVLETSHKDLEERIFHLGGEKVLDGDLIALRLDLENKYSFGQPELVRIRSEGNLVKLTHKKKIIVDGVNSYEENEISSIDKLDDVLSLFESLGYSIITRDEKRRVSYKLDFKGGFVKLDFDKYHGTLEQIPEFLEVESNSKANILQGIELLGIGDRQITNYSLGDLRKHYGLILN